MNIIRKRMRGLLIIQLTVKERTLMASILNIS
nr:MAG TPA: hypothetical protein [Bacteriophage sp.]